MLKFQCFIRTDIVCYLYDKEDSTVLCLLLKNVASELSAAVGTSSPGDVLRKSGQSSGVIGVAATAAAVGGGREAGRGGLMSVGGAKRSSSASRSAVKRLVCHDMLLRTLIHRSSVFVYIFMYIFSYVSDCKRYSPFLTEYLSSLFSISN